MQNDPELDGKYLGKITNDFIKVSNTLKEAAYLLRARKIAEYPIFPISQDKIEVGQLLIAKDETDLELEWNYHFSYLDEFIQRQLVDEEKIEEFKAAFKDPDEFCCLFVVDKDFVNFVYIPYPED
ncbi:hypothetical protein [Chondrinema litorale]|uniref:hypothetical protein n=1 Tax=Chondrinema litorale TaxID=2994555 RepID=UPI002543CFE9|nr:hypothetical protein [Chondrinema litorale]UZR93835.1 hypothetical protein OQ292_18470 [Chondrinema litorale]